MIIDAPAISVPAAPAIIRPATADLLLSPAYWPADSRQRVLAFRDLRGAGRFSPDQIREAAAIWKTKGAIILFAPVFFINGELPRIFTISPAVSGKTTWDLDVDGPLVLSQAGTWTVTPSSGFAGSVDLNGGGGGAGAFVSGNNGTAGTASTFAGLSAGGGARSTGPGANVNGTGAAGGTASGGDVNTNGGAGGNGSVGSTSTGGTGGASPNGGATVAGGSSSSIPGKAGTAGNGPGGGGSGGGQGSPQSSSRYAPGGGGGGAYVQKDYAKGALTGTQSLVVGLGGAGNTATYAGGNGAAGRARIT